MQLSPFSSTLHRMIAFDICDDVRRPFVVAFLVGELDVTPYVVQKVVTGITENRLLLVLVCISVLELGNIRVERPQPLRMLDLIFSWFCGFGLSFASHLNFGFLVAHLYVMAIYPSHLFPSPCILALVRTFGFCLELAVPCSYIFGLRSCSVPVSCTCFRLLHYQSGQQS